MSTVLSTVISTITSTIQATASPGGGGTPPLTIVLHALFNGGAGTKIDVYTCDIGGPFVYPDPAVDYELNGTGAAILVANSNGPEFDVGSQDGKVTGTFTRNTSNMGIKARNSEVGANAAATINMRVTPGVAALRYGGTDQDTFAVPGGPLTGFLLVSGSTVEADVAGHGNVVRLDAPAGGQNFGFFSSDAVNLTSEILIEA